jgi:cytochrome c oxidase subunit 2
VNKWWSILFGVVMTACTLLFIVAPFVGWWLPKNVSVFGGRVDALFYFILAITGFFFLLTEALLVYFMYTYAGGTGAKEHVVGHHYAEKKVFWTSFFKSIARPVTRIIHDQHRLELAWTLVPGVILLIIAVVQINVWAEIKYPNNMPQVTGNDKPQQIEVVARQFEWRLRYPGPDRLARWKKQPGEAGYEDPNRFAQVQHADDVYVVNEVHTWKDQKVLVHLRTRDVIHSFYLPNLRLKQDALPGKTIKVWFMATEANTSKVPNADRWEDGKGYDAKGQPNDPHYVWDLACAELCGWGHYKMHGKLYVHETEADYLEWLKSAEARQQSTKAQ